MALNELARMCVMFGDRASAWRHFRRSAELTEGVFKKCFGTNPLYVDSCAWALQCATMDIGSVPFGPSLSCPHLPSPPHPPHPPTAGGWIGGRPGRLLGHGPSCSSSYLTSCACFIWLHASQDSCSTVVTPLLLLTLVLVSAEWCCGGRWWC